MATPQSSFLLTMLATALLLVGCGTGDLSGAARDGVDGENENEKHGNPPPAPPTFDPNFDPQNDAGADGSSAKKKPVDPVFDLRLKQQIRGVVREDYAAYDWDSLLHQDEPFSGVKIWIPGTSERTADDSKNGRAMVAIPDGLASYGPAVIFVAGSPASTSVWFGTPCSQSEGGARFAVRGPLSALEVFDTAWSDAKEIAARLGPHVKGAWIVAHSAGANPAILTALIGKAHRVDVYGLPSAVGPLDGEDGIVHTHTHPLDPAGAMGKLVDNGAKAEIDLVSAAATVIKAGGTMEHHKYGTWPAPSL